MIPGKCEELRNNTRQCDLVQISPRWSMNDRNVVVVVDENPVSDEDLLRQRFRIRFQGFGYSNDNCCITTKRTMDDSNRMDERDLWKEVVTDVWKARISSRNWRHNCLSTERSFMMLLNKPKYSASRDKITNVTLFMRSNWNKVPFVRLCLWDEELSVTISRPAP